MFQSVQKVLSSSLLTRHEPGKVRLLDLWIITCMLQEKRVNFASIFMEKLKAASKTITLVSIGELVTPIALHFDVNLNVFAPQPDSVKLDFVALRHARMISSVSPLFSLLQKREDHVPLPQPFLTGMTTMEDRRNWLLDTPTHIAWKRNHEPNMEDDEEEETYAYLSRQQSRGIHGRGSAERRETKGCSKRRESRLRTRLETVDEKTTSIDA